MKNQRNVVSEFYDEIIFQVGFRGNYPDYLLTFDTWQDPTQNIHPLLTTTRQLSLGKSGSVSVILYSSLWYSGAYKHETDFEEKKKTSLLAIKDARTKVQAEIAEMKSKLELAKTTNTKFKDEILKVQKEKGLEPTIF